MPCALASSAVRAREHDDVNTKSILVRSTVPVAPHPAKMTERLEHWALHAPDRTFLAKREGGGDWRRISYAESLAQVRSIASALLTRKLSADRPIVLLSGNDIEHALLTLAAMKHRDTNCAHFTSLFACVLRLR